MQFLSGEGRWSSVMMTVGSLLGYAFLVEPLGFFISTLLLLLFLFRFIGNLKWWVVFTGMVLVTLMTHVLFKVALKVQLPGGPFQTVKGGSFGITGTISFTAFPSAWTP